MKQFRNHHIIFFVALFITSLLLSCNAIDEELHNDEMPVQIYIQTNDIKSHTRATDDGSDEEREIQNLFIYLFSADGTQLYQNRVIRFSQSELEALSTWGTSEQYVVLEGIYPSDVNERKVYVVSNVLDDHLTTQLLAVRNENTLRNLVHDDEDGFATISTPLLMEGSVLHNFTAASVRATVDLDRVVAKIFLTLKNEITGIAIIVGVIRLE